MAVNPDLQTNNSFLNKLYNYFFAPPTEEDILRDCERIQQEMDAATIVFTRNIQPLIGAELPNEGDISGIERTIFDTHYQTFMQHFRKAEDFLAGIEKYITRPEGRKNIKAECQNILTNFIGISEIKRQILNIKIRCVYEDIVPRNNYFIKIAKETFSVFIKKPYMITEKMAGGKIAAIGVFSIAFFASKLVSWKTTTLALSIFFAAINSYFAWKNY